MRVFIRLHGQMDWAGSRLDGELLWVFSMALPQSSGKMVLSSCQPQGLVLLRVEAISQVMSISSLLVAQNVPAVRGLIAQVTKGNFKQSHKIMEKVEASLEKSRKQSEDGYVCTWIFFLGQRSFLCKWRAAKSDPFLLPPEGLGHEISVPGSLLIDRTLGKLCQPLLSVLPCSIPCYIPFFPLGQLVALVFLPWVSPTRTAGKETAAAGAAHGAAWERLSHKTLSAPTGKLLGFSTAFTVWRAFGSCEIMWWIMVGEH